MKFLAFLLVAIFVAVAVAVSVADAYNVDVCILEPFVIGPCRAYFLSYSYNPETNECSEFGYGGCHGNGNRFDSKEACEAACKE